MDFSKQRWCEADNLGDRVFVLSKYEFGASCSGGEAGLRHNCVYFVDHRQNRLHVFNVNGSIELQKLDDAPVSDNAFWVLPTDLA
jgi:1,4-dihydroxy-2-naphthoyl-CoA synthase